MSSLNKAIIIGRLGRDPEVRHTNDGKAVVTLNVATSESWKDKSGQKQEKAEWHRCVLFGNLADIAAKYLTKGANVYLEGKLQTRKWTNQQGQDQYTTEIVIDGFSGQMVMLGGNGEAKPQPASQAAPQTATKADVPFDDDIPF